jgi:hypothetical protein
MAFVFGEENSSAPSRHTGPSVNSKPVATCSTVPFGGAAAWSSSVAERIQM